VRCASIWRWRRNCSIQTVTVLVNSAVEFGSLRCFGEVLTGSDVSVLRSPRLMILIIAFAPNIVIGNYVIEGRAFAF